MKVAKVTIEAPVTSFRYPHFLIGRQLSFDMPPPSTIYGHIASALGEWFDPSGVKFAYRFQVEAIEQDLEYQQIIVAGGSPSKFEYEGCKYPTSVSGNSQPHLRDFLYGCSLELYLDPADLGEAFLNPAFCVCLGRSQDLAKITAVEEIELVQAKAGYFEATVLPFSMRKYTGRGVTVLMPRYIVPPPDRDPTFNQYIVLRERMFTEQGIGSPFFLKYEGEEEKAWWVDPTSPKINGVFRCLVFHTFTDGE